jgi:hypothetical protein
VSDLQHSAMDAPVMEENGSRRRINRSTGMRVPLNPL